MFCLIGLVVLVYTICTIEAAAIQDDYTIMVINHTIFKDNPENACCGGYICPSDAAFCCKCYSPGRCCAYSSSACYLCP